MNVPLLMVLLFTDIGLLSFLKSSQLSRLTVTLEPFYAALCNLEMHVQNVLFSSRTWILSTLPEVPVVALMLLQVCHWARLSSRHF